MKGCMKGFSDWPRTSNNRPIFHKVDQALLFAQLMYNRPDEVSLLEVYLNDCYIKLRDQRQQNNPDIEEIVHLIFKGRLFKVCLEECQRIKNETLASII